MNSPPGRDELRAAAFDALVERKAEQVTARERGALYGFQQRFRIFQEREAARLLQIGSDDLDNREAAPLSESLEELQARRHNQSESNDLQPNSGKKKSFVSSIWFFFKIKMLRLSFSSDQREPSIMSSGLAHIFSYKELKKATDCFKQQIGNGGFSSVYLGKLRNGQSVAVKVIVLNSRKCVKELTNEVKVLSELRHPNLVSLYGCTNPGSRKLLLVYEFVPNGTLYDHLQGKLSHLPWIVRMQIAIETAKAITYLHSLEPPVIHLNVKTSNILVDKEFHVKVNFGMCHLLPLDKICVTTEPQGTQGYGGPDYDKSFKLSAKSDVYSFGIVLLELISEEHAVDVNRQEGDIYLFRMVINKIMDKELDRLIDRKIGYHYDCENYDYENRRMIDSVAELACLCLQPDANVRPSMKEVLSSLTATGDRIEPIECEPSKTE